MSSKSQNIPLFLDEIQAAPELFANFLTTSEKFNELFVSEIEKETAFGGGIGFGKLNDALKLLVAHIKQKNVLESEHAILSAVLGSSDASPRV